jgi:hypothetical protein
VLIAAGHRLSQATQALTDAQSTLSADEQELSATG